MLDANGCNTTAASAVLAALEACELRKEAVDRTRVLVLGGTGPVGQRVARLLANLGAKVVVGSRKLERAKGVAEVIEKRVGRAIEAVETSTEDQTKAALQGVRIAIAAGALGATLLPESVRSVLPPFLALIDLNAVPPLGIEALAATDKRKELPDGALGWGALGIGGAKMKLHKKAIQELFTSNDKRLDAEEVLEIARG